MRARVNTSNDLIVEVQNSTGSTADVSINVCITGNFRRLSEVLEFLNLTDMNTYVYAS